jgi:hypothetical protein
VVVSGETEGIAILVAEHDGQWLSEDRVWKRIDPTTLRANLTELVAGLQDALPLAESPSGFAVSEVRVAVKVGAGAEVGLLGTGIDVSGEATLTLTMTRS